MKIDRFEDIIAWQKAKGLAVSVYDQFKDCSDFGFRDQICRAAVSIMNNIAEGFERQTAKELRQSLYIAKGSNGEVRSMLHLAKELNYLPVDSYYSLHNNSIEISKILSGFIKSL